jgi:hypothetical protein
MVEQGNVRSEGVATVSSQIPHNAFNVFSISFGPHAAPACLPSFTQSCLDAILQLPMHPKNMVRSYPMVPLALRQSCVRLG